MVKVDNVGVLVLEGSVPVWMAMRFLSLPALVFVLMMLVVDMQVLVLQRLVQVFDLDRVVGRPQNQGGGCRSQSYKRKHRKSSRKPERASDPAGERWAADWAALAISNLRSHLRRCAAGRGAPGRAIPCLSDWPCRPHTPGVGRLAHWEAGRDAPAR